MPGLMSGSLLVTGASGFVGHHVVAECVRRGHRVRALVRPTSRTEGLAGVELARGDIASGQGLRAAVSGVDVVLHLAGLVKALDRSEFFAVNAGGTRRLLEACLCARERPRRVVCVSSLAAAGPSRYGRPRAEDDPPGPISWYGRSKLAGEREALARAGEIEVVVVRPPAVYGPRDRENALFLKAARSGWVTRFEGALERLSLVEVADLVDGILLAAEHERAPGRTYFLAHPEVLSMEEMIGLMARELGANPRFVTLPGGLVRLAGGVSHLFGRVTNRAPMFSLHKVPELLAPDWTCSPGLAMRELGFAPRRSAEIGIPRFVAWFDGREAAG